MLNYYLRPSRKNTNRDVFDEFFAPDFFTREVKGMRTDVTETEKEYLLEIELPGFNKENVEISVENGYLTVSAKKDEEKETKNDRYVSRERYTGSLTRSWYVGEIDQEQIKASFNNGVLNVSVPKEQKQKEKKLISID